MSEFKYPESTYEWLTRKGIVYKCYRHKAYYDSHIGCPRCQEEAFNKTKESMRQKIDTLFSNVIWLNDEQSK